MLPKEQETSTENEQSEIPKVLSFFELGLLENASLLSGGTVNHNYLVVAKGGQEYVIKFPIEESKESLENDRAIEEQLSQAGIDSTVYCLAPNGEFIYDEVIATVISPKIEGITPEKVDEQLSFAIGKVLADYHQAVTKLPNHHDGWLNQRVVIKPNTQEEHPFTQQARRYIEEGEVVFSQNLPKGIIHGDFYEGNLLVDPEDKSKITAIFDFEEAEENLFIVDITRTMLAVCTANEGTRLDRNLMKALQAGYTSVRPLEAEEIVAISAALKYAAGACILWYMNNAQETSARDVIARVKSLTE